MKKIVRIIALGLAVLMILSGMASAVSLLVSAAPASYDNVVVRETDTGKIVDVLKKTKYDITFTYYDDLPPDYIASLPANTTEFPSFSCSSSGFTIKNWSKENARLTLKPIEKTSDTKWQMEASITGIEYKGSQKEDYLELRSITAKTDSEPKYEYKIGALSVMVPSNYSSGGGSGGTIDDPTNYTSAIVVENAIALDSAGNRIDVVNKDTPAFTLEIIFADIGLQQVDAKDMKDADIQTYITTPGGFILGSSAKGRVAVTSTNGDYPRFRATFSNVKYNGTGNAVGFEVYYILDDVDAPVKGGATATLYAAKGEDDKDDDKLGLAVPKIVISQYSYGGGSITAGSEFSLDFTLTNTSKELPLENIVLTLTPTSNDAAKQGPGLIVASSSNTIYLPGLAAGASQSHSVAFQARPDAEVTSHLITIKSSYEYVDTKLKERKVVPDQTESIAIPVSQVDRFSVDPITDEPYTTVGDEVYLTVNFINRGKSTSYNISGQVKGDASLIAPSQHFGNLEAGKSDSLDFPITGNQAGQFEGQVVIQYEDENSNQKEIVTPFVIMVEEPYMPPMEPEFPDGMNPEGAPPTGPGAMSIVLCSVGGLSIAAPICLYLIKRVKAKGSEDFDENF